MKPVRVGLVGLGKIARDQHLSALAANPAFQLVACVTREPAEVDVPVFSTVGDMLGSAELDAVVS